MPTADAHIHLFATGFAGTLGSSPAGSDELAAYERSREHYGIERSLVIGYEGEPRYAGNNREILDLASERRWMVPLAYVPLTPPPTVEDLRELHSRGAAGIALYLRREDDGRALCAWSPATFAELCKQQALVSLNAVPAATALIADVIDRLGSVQPSRAAGTIRTLASAHRSAPNACAARRRSRCDWASAS